jgi:membrane associated rhomboid family serine protease
VRVTVTLVAANVLVYSFMLANAAPSARFEFDADQLIAYGANHVGLVRDGQVWRLFTAMFIHITPLHLASNMAALAFLGRRLEVRYGALRYVVVYLLSGLCGSLASVAYFWRSPEVAAGASGAISGLLGAAIMTAYLAGESGRRFRNSMLAWVGLLVVLGLTEPVDNAAHFGGLAAGAIVARLFGRGISAPLFRDEEERPMGADIALRPVFCRDCGARVPPKARTCPACGRSQVVACAGCGQDNIPGSRFCGRCGLALSEPEPSPQV